jgi:uncharacterized membrane protein
MNALASKSVRTIAAASVLGLLVLLGLVVAPAASATAAGNDVTWTVRTASNKFGAERTSYSYTLTPGTEVSDALVIANRGTTALDLGFYAADGFTTESGQFDLVAGGEKSVAIGAWVRSGAEHVTVGAGKTVKVPFSLSVPTNATPGDYAGGVVTSLVQPDQAQGINVDRRLGIRIAVRVGGDLKPGLAIENTKLSWNGGLNPFAGGDATLSYTLHNTGNATVSAEHAATLAGPFGWGSRKAGSIGAPPQLLPGEKWTVSIPFTNVPALFVLTATTSVTPTVVDASGSTSSLTPVIQSAKGAAVPWMLLLIVLVIALAVVATLLLRKRGRAKQLEAQDARVQEAVEAALAEAKTLEGSNS